MPRGMLSGAGGLVLVIRESRRARKLLDQLEQLRPREALRDQLADLVLGSIHRRREEITRGGLLEIRREQADAGEMEPSLLECGKDDRELPRHARRLDALERRVLREAQTLDAVGVQRLRLSEDAALK